MTYALTEEQRGDLRADLGIKQGQQSVSLTGSPTGGTFTLTYEGATTAPIAYNATTTAVQAALAALSTIGAGNVAVSGMAGDWVVSFGGVLASATASVMTADGSGLTGGTAPGVTVFLVSVFTDAALDRLYDRNGGVYDVFKARALEQLLMGGPILWFNYTVGQTSIQRNDTANRLLKLLETWKAEAGITGAMLQAGVIDTDLDEESTPDELEPWNF